MSILSMARTLGLSASVRRGGAGISYGRVLDLDMATGRDYSAPSITSSSAIGLVPVYAGDGVKTYVPKTAGMLAGWDGVRVISNLIPASVQSGTGLNLSSATITHLGSGEYEATLTGASLIFVNITGQIGNAIASADIRWISGSTNIQILPGSNNTAGAASITLTADYRRYASGIGSDAGVDGFALKLASGSSVIRFKNAQCEMVTAINQTVPSMYVDPTSSAGWITDPVTGERAYHLGSGIALSWTKPGGSVDGSGVFTPTLGNPISGLRWVGPRAATTTINAYSKPTPGTNGWALTGATDGGDVAGPDGNATSARQVSFSAFSQACFISISGTTSTSIVSAFIIKGTNGNKINVYYGGANNSVSWQITLNGSWQAISVPGAVTGTPSGATLSLNTFNTAWGGGSGVTASQTVDVFMLQISTAPDAYIATTGTNLTRLAETVTDTVAALGANFSIMGTLDLSGGLPTSTLDIITSGADKIQVTTTGQVVITDGTLTTTSTATLSAAAGQKFGISRTAAGSTLQIGTTQEAGDAVDWTGDAVLTIGIGAPVQRWSVWRRAIKPQEMTSYA